MISSSSIVKLVVVSISTFVRGDNCVIKFPDSGHIEDISADTSERYSQHATLGNGFIDIYPDTSIAYEIIQEDELGSNVPTNPYILFERSTSDECDLLIELNLTQVRIREHDPAVISDSN